MSKLADYNPLAKLKFGGIEIDPSGLIVITGPNSSGKTHLLRDIEKYLLTGVPDGVVCKHVNPRRPDDPGVLFQDLLDRQLIRNIQAGQGQTTDQFETYLPRFSRRRGQAHPEERPRFNSATLEKIIASFNLGYGGNNPHFFQSIGLALVAYLPLESRQEICARSDGFHHRNKSPETALQGLQLDSNAQDVISRETGRVFGNAVWLDISEHNTLQLRMSGRPELPSAGDMVNPMRAGKYFSIQDEGDGLQSYVGACITLLLGLRPVVLLDEPELCLHPPQAYQMGKFIGERAAASRVTFVATHSSHVLRGILDAGMPVTVVRLTHHRREFFASLVPDGTLRAAVRNPRSRAEATLDGVFARGVIVVESEGDREVYQAACEADPGYPSREVHFVCTGGTGGLAEIASFYATLRVPVAVISDLDILAEPGRLLATLAALNPGADLADCQALLQETAQALKALPSAITEAAVIDQLRELAGLDLNWQRGDDGLLRGKLNKLSKSVYRVGRLKEGGVEAYADHPNVQRLISESIETCGKFGVFLVPVGELELWVTGLMDGVPKSSGKMELAYEMAARMRAAPNKSGDVWAFAQSVLDYLNARGEAETRLPAEPGGES
jgi:hypothetical protein